MTERSPCTLHQVSEHIWWFTPEARTDRPSLALVVGSKHTLMLDIGASSAHTREFLIAIANHHLPAPDFAILTHWHWDHCFGIDALDIPIAAHEITASHIATMQSYDYSDRGLNDLVERGIENAFIRDHMVIELNDEQRSNLKLRQPDILFQKSYTYDLGTVKCEDHHVGGDHSEDSCVIYIPQDKVLFLGDCFYYTVYQEPRHYTKKLLTLVEQLEAFDAEIYVEGHSNTLITSTQMRQWFAIVKQVFALIESHGIEDTAFLFNELSAQYGEEDVSDFLEPILEGFKYSLAT